MKLEKVYLNIMYAAKKAPLIIIMGHKDLDLDAVGACIGMYSLLSRKKCYILIDDKIHELGVGKVLKNIANNIKITTTAEIENKITSDTLIVVVDTNKNNLVQSPTILNKCKNIIVVDHHDIGSDTIDASIKVIDTKSSSVCEIITEFYVKKRKKIPEGISLVLLSGIVLDTNNFVLKTTENTYYAAYYLAKNGAKTRDVQYLLKQDLKEYIERQHVITDVKIKKNIAITKGADNVVYRREDLAKIADTLIMFNDISASFVIGKLKGDIIGISSRSIGDIDVGNILEIIGGGGDIHEAAAKIQNSSINDVEKKIIELIK